MSLAITVSGADPLSLNVDAVAILVPTGAKQKGALKAVLAKLGTSARKAIKLAEFTGKKGQICELPTAGKLKASAVLLVGVGDPADLRSSCVRRLAAKAARRAQGNRCHSFGFELPAMDDAARYAAEGAVLGSYYYEQFKTKDYRAKHAIGKVSLVVHGKVTTEHRAAAALGQRVGEAVCLARDLINMPPNELYPDSFAAYAKQVAKDNKADGLSCTVLSHKQLKDKGMNLLDAVGRGSRKGPCVIHLKYTPPTSGKGKKTKPVRKLVFVGKGLTFDTGGICIKPAAGMEEMKGDMGGAANVVALMAALAATKPNAEIHGIIASAENMPDGDAYRPGDVFTAYSGKTVEIINTDAEGRLALADVLHYATELEPDFILDNATLTGACVVALGQTVSAFYSNRTGLAARMTSAAELAGEAMWHMPLVEDLREKLKSDYADFKHMGDRWGGSITAALFLREYIGESRWIHVDIAGPSMADKSYDIYSKGGTGHGVLTYMALIDDLIANGVGE